MKQAVGAAIAAVVLGWAAPGSAATLIASGTIPDSGGVSSVTEFIAFPPDIYFYTKGDYLFAEGEAAYDEIFGVITDAGASYGFVPAYFGAPATITSISNGFKVSFDLLQGDPPVHFEESYDGISDGYTAYHELNYLGVQVSALFTQDSAGKAYFIYDGAVADPFPSVVPEPATWAMMIAGSARRGRCCGGRDEDRPASFWRGRNGASARLEIAMVVCGLAGPIAQLCRKYLLFASI